MSGLRIVLQRLVGPLVFFAGMVACMTIGEPLALGVGLTWRNVVAMCAIPWLCGYTGYHMGWINGHYAGWIKARDEHRPNAPDQARLQPSPEAGCSRLVCAQCGAEETPPYDDGDACVWCGGDGKHASGW